MELCGVLLDIISSEQKETPMYFLSIGGSTLGPLTEPQWQCIVKNVEELRITKDEEVKRLLNEIIAYLCENKLSNTEPAADKVYVFPADILVDVLNVPKLSVGGFKI